MLASNLERDPPTSASQVLGFKACATMYSCQILAMTWLAPSMVYHLAITISIPITFFWAQYLPPQWPLCLISTGYGQLPSTIGPIYLCFHCSVLQNACSFLTIRLCSSNCLFLKMQVAVVFYHLFTSITQAKYFKWCHTNPMFKTLIKRKR